MDGEWDLCGVRHRAQWSGRTGGVRGSAPGTASEEWEWELYGVQYREQRIEDRRDAEEPEWGL